MAHAYTPGLRVTETAIVRRERRLPLKGEVLAALGDAVAPDTVVARASLPGSVLAVSLASRLGLVPARALESLLVPVGASVRRGERIAESKGLFGLVRTGVDAPADGTVESVSSATGQLLLREPSVPVEIAAYVRGTIVDVLAGEGVVVEARCAFLQGIFGVGGEIFGPLQPVGSGPADELRAEYILPSHRGCVLVGGAYVSHDTLVSAREAGVAAVVVGGFDDRDLRRLLGRELGVAITGSEDLGITLVLTEGFGRIPMADRTWELLSQRRGDVASVSGATQIRAGVLRPEILVPFTGGDLQPPVAEAEGGLEVGATVRIIRQPNFGSIGRVVDLPQALHALETEAKVRVLVVELADGSGRVTVPRANVERVAR